MIPYFDGLHKPGCAVAAVVGVQSGETPAGPRLQARFSHFFADERIGEQLSSVALPSLLELETKDKRRIARISQSWRLKVPTSAFTFKTLV